MTSSNFWLTIIGLILAPTPTPVGSSITRSGVEKYSLPLFPTLTLIISPFSITGIKDAFLPCFMVIIGFLWLFNIVDPYPVPAS